MDGGILVLGALVVLGIPVAIIVLLVGQASLSKRVKALELEYVRMNREAAAAKREDAPAIAPKPKAKAKAKAAKAADAVVSDAKTSSEIPKETPRRRPVAPPPEPSKSQEALARFSTWLQTNWFYVVSAVSLALAGVFLVQYGIENDMFPPRARILAAIGFGAALIGAGEFIRRKYGDSEDVTTAYLPSVFSGAGIVTLFSAFLAARVLYDLIGAEAALGGMVVTALIAIVLGWFHGPLLAAVGVIGAFAAPFVVGGSSDDVSWFYAYFFVIAFVGLAIDTVRQWTWISVLSLAGAAISGWLLYLGAPDTTVAFVAYLIGLTVAAITIPTRALTPHHDGSMVMEWLAEKGGKQVPFVPTQLAGATIAFASASLAIIAHESEWFWIATAALALIALGLLVWAAEARALRDTVLLPVIGLLFATVVLQPIVPQTDASIQGPSSFEWGFTVMVVIGAFISALAAWRAIRDTRVWGDFSLVWAGLAALVAPVMGILIEVLHAPSNVIGAYPWALHAAALAVLMVFIAERFAKADASDRLRIALPVLSALSCITFGFVILFSSAALTVAIAATVVAAAALDRKFNLPAMAIFITIGVVAIGYRLLGDPGIFWAFKAPFTEVVLAYGGSLAATLAALWLIKPLDRSTSKITLDSAAWSFGGLFASVLLYHAISVTTDSDDIFSHWGLGLLATVWFGAAFAQIQRWDIGGRMLIVRRALAAIFGGIGLAALAFGVVLTNPVASSWFGKVMGPPVFNTLAVAYLLPAAVMFAAIWRLPKMKPWIRKSLMGLSVFLCVLWVGLVIRHFWQGADGMHRSGFTQPELYSYTIALLIAGAGLFYQSLARHSDLMRKAGLVVIGLAVIKVFFVDIGNLDGLTRVFSLLVLGLALAVLAWLNRWAQAKTSAAEPKSEDP